ncbi:MAG: threonine ammonia-lyase, biosynthetic, partial [Gammaproteobacteria bacterium]|nr:threonine ammonia-lyase, biosynthetic [Gammaproteobacteria bacterium]
MKLDSVVKRILDARVYDVATRTPLDAAPVLSRRLNNHVWLKREDLQPVFSFKLRGAYNRMAHLTEAERANGVVCASAGNHAQGVALSAQKLGVKATIVMPRTTPDIKVQNVRNLGAKVVLVGDAYDDASAHAQELVESTGATYVHPYDDEQVIAGQGTIAREILEQAPSDLEAVFVPVGGGGLVAGVAAYIKYLRPNVKVIGVEPEDAPTLHDALAAQRRVTLKNVGLFADGVAVKQIGKKTFDLAKQYVDEVVLVSVDQICAAIADVFDDTRSIAEPAGALAVAGLKKYVQENGLEDKHLAAIESGANINFHRLRHVSERAELGEAREALFAVEIPEKPGSFKRFCSLLGKRAITEFNYRYSHADKAQIFVGLALADSAEKAEVLNKLGDAGYAVVDMTDNEMAKLHVRYMVGGPAPQVADTE